MTAKVAARRLPCRNPAAGLTILSQSVGTVGLHDDHILESLVEVSPHICFLQEARTSGDADLRAWRCQLRAWGFQLHLEPRTHLRCLWRRGLNLAPIAAPLEAASWRVAYYALQLRRSRALLRNVHDPADGAQQRRMMRGAVQATDGALSCIEMGDYSGPVEDGVDAVAFPRLCPLADGTCVIVVAPLFWMEPLWGSPWPMVHA